jgi:response regulator RpfG family c-di-GMP phosphodiesterase
MDSLYSPQILVVDDSSVIRRLLAKQLRDIGAQVTQAYDGVNGLDLARKRKFDLIITDVDMPRMDGFGLCENLKKILDTRGIPVVILSSMDSEKDIEKGFQVGAAAYISKSDASSQLPGIVDKVLQTATFHHERLILVVDDSATIRGIVKKALEESGFKVLTAENGQRALELMENQKPDLILSDIEMPVMNGADLCRKVHLNDSNSSIPFVVMSTKNERAIMRRMLQWGATAYLTKPFNTEQLVITIERLLSNHFLLLLKEKERLDVERKMMLASITSLIEALEARDPYTRGHSESVADILIGIAEIMGADSNEIEMLGTAGRLHDLGKIGVPDHILLKPGRLTDEEYEKIKQHPVAGATIFSPIKTLNNIIPIILHHHERFDGKGYPDGIKGDQIPLWARVTAVADTYHALTSDRPYRKGMESEKALQIIEDVRGTQLCPDCIDAFLTWIAMDRKEIEKRTQIA